MVAGSLPRQLLISDKQYYSHPDVQLGDTAYRLFHLDLHPNLPPNLPV